MTATNYAPLTRLPSVAKVWDIAIINRNGRLIIYERHPGSTIEKTPAFWVELYTKCGYSTMEQCLHRLRNERLKDLASRIINPTI